MKREHLIKSVILTLSLLLPFQSYTRCDHREKTIIVTHKEKDIRTSDLAKGIAGVTLILGGITMFSPEAAAALWKFLILITEQPRYQPTVILHHTHPNWFSWYSCNLCR